MKQAVGKLHLAKKLADKTSLTKREASLVVDALFDPTHGIIVSALAHAEKVKIPGFGTFTVRSRANREGRNPTTGQPIRVPSKDYVSFKPGTGLKAIAAGASYSPPLGVGHGIERGTRMLCPVNPKECPPRYRRAASQVLWCENGHPRAQMVPETELARRGPG
jgi:DNA-binding protein HU-beta